MKTYPILNATLPALLFLALFAEPALAQRSQCSPARHGGPSVRRCVKSKGPLPRQAWKPQERGGWEVTWAPYLWAAGLHGDVGVGGNVTEIDMSFRDVLDHLDYGIYLPVEMRMGRWSTVIELMASKVSGEKARPRAVLFTNADLTSNQMTIELSPRYRITRPGPVDVDLIGGFRLWQISSTLELSGNANLTTGLGEMWFDPIMGSRVIAKFGKGFVQARGDIGGFGVGSRFTWQGLGALGYRISSVTSVAGGYRYLKVNYENDDDDFLFDTAMSGPIVGVAIRLGGGGASVGNGPIPVGR